MAASFPTPSAGDVWGQQLIDAITERLSPVVRVVTGAEPRPSGALVLWVGGQVQPANMGVDDLWFAENATAPVGYDPQVGEHSIWGTSAYPWAVAKATDSALTVATGFYSYGTDTTVNAWRIVGAKLWVPEGVSFTGPLEFKVWNVGQTYAAPDLGAAPLAEATMTDFVAGAWNAVMFPAPVETNIGDLMFIGYRSGGGELVGLTPALPQEYVLALDGSKIAQAENIEISWGRSYYRYDGAATNRADGSVYGIDVIFDEGP